MTITLDEIERSSWNRRISLQHVKSYVEAAIDLYETLVVLEDQGYEAAVFPSRGTTPFKDLTWIVHRSDLVERRGPTRWQHDLNKPFGRRTITLPFTADAPKSTVDGSAQIRDYWVRVLRAILEQDSASAELRYYQYCTEVLFGFERVRGLPLNRVGKRFVFVDTVVSGQAVCEIVSSFKAHGLEDFYLVLLVDENGRKLKPHYRKVIEDLARRGKAKLIYVDLLFTEDEGPAFTSTWCLSAPQLVEAAYGVVCPSAKTALVGTAVSFVRVQADDILDNVTSTCLRATLDGVLSAAMGEILAPEHVRDCYTQVLEMNRIELISLAILNQRNGFDPLSTTETERTARNAIGCQKSIGLHRRPIGLSVTDVGVSSSHVVRLYFTDAAVDGYLRGYAQNSAPALLSVHEP
ncbi:hypothetical protein FHR51_000382 [Xanthomonas arboricola]|uniref:hypothetical protein n=1 Tax=Xanthomonas cannabis TaxID=1885674 RepID=UPI001610E9C0|nr:hypothetical protein [Xanthomonas cannabis]MBB3804271.1 hypothetical protein [Xanthomonas cannabis]